MTARRHRGVLVAPREPLRPAAVIGLGLLATGAAAVLVQAAGPAMNDPDSAASVLFWEHLVSGRRLETFVSTTPKPILTALYGIGLGLTGDWRMPGWLTLVAFGVLAASSARLVSRSGGPWAAAFLLGALVLSPAMVLEVSRANSLIWGAAGWAVAGMALTERPRRPWLAGVALLVAMSCRTETIVLLGLVTLAVVWLRIKGDRASALALAPAMLGWAAIPLAGLHDLLLVGDPLAWLGVPAGYTALVGPGRVMQPVALLAEIVTRYAGLPILSLLAAGGILALVWRREWPVAIAVTGLGLGVAGLLVVISWRGIFVTTRYLEQVDLAILFAAAVAVGVLGEVGLAWARGARRIPFGLPSTAALAFVAALALVSWPSPSPVDGELQRELDRVRQSSVNADIAIPILRGRLAAEGAVAPPPIDGPGGLRIVDTRTAAVLVPRPLINRLIVDLDAPATVLGDSLLAFRDRGAAASIERRQVILHDRAADLGAALYAPLEIAGPTEIDGVSLVPLLVDAGRGIWIVEAVPR